MARGRGVYCQNGKIVRQKMKPIPIMAVPKFLASLLSWPHLKYFPGQTGFVISPTFSSFLAMVGGLLLSPMHYLEFTFTHCALAKLPGSNLWFQVRAFHLIIYRPFVTATNVTLAISKCYTCDLWKFWWFRRHVGNLCYWALRAA